MVKKKKTKKKKRAKRKSSAKAKEKKTPSAKELPKEGKEAVVVIKQPVIREVRKMVKDVIDGVVDIFGSITGTSKKRKKE